MKIGLHIADFTCPSGRRGLADDLTRVAATAEEQGFARVSVMDHVWQIGAIGPAEHEMLEAYTTLGYLAARTSEVELLAWVTAVTYRSPGMLAKLVTHARRALAGAGLARASAPAWNEDEATGLGLRSRRWPSGSSASRRRCRSACRCGATTTGRTRASTTGCAAR